MPITCDEFDAKVPDWQDWQDTPWGRLYYTLQRANLARHLPDRRLRILDVGGGNGADTLYYAAQGHQVTMLDYAPAMLEDALRRARSAGLADAITYTQMDADRLDDPELTIPGEPFDLALCHLMVHFTPRPKAVLCGVLPRLAPGGLLSLVDTNPYSEVYRRVFQPGSSPAVDALASAGGSIGMTEYPHPWFDRLTPIFSAQGMIELFQNAGARLVGHYGVRCLCDYIPNEWKFDPVSYDQLEALELRLSGEFPYYLLARFYQIIVSRSSCRCAAPSS